MGRTKSRKGFVVQRRPKSYELTPQQQKMRRVVHECGIEKGIGRKELREKMINCVGPRMRESESKDE